MTATAPPPHRLDPPGGRATVGRAGAPDRAAGTAVFGSDNGNPAVRPPERFPLSETASEPGSR